MRLFSVTLLVLVAACDRDRIETRRVAKESPPAMEGLTPPISRQAGLKWKIPSGWKELPGNAMRVATFELPTGAGKAEATVVALPGDVGGALANVNRWRGQIALPAITEDQLAGAQTTVRCAAGDVFVYDFTSGGAKKTRLIAGMIQASGTMWFFKLMGDDTAVTAAKPAFVKLLEGLKADAP